MSDQKSSLQKIITPLLGAFVALTFSFSIFVYTQVRDKPSIGYIDMRAVVNALVADIRTKNQNILEPKIQELSAKVDEYKKKKEEFERKKARGKSSENTKTSQKLDKLKKEIEDTEKTLNEEFSNRFNNDIGERMKEVTQGVEDIRKESQCNVLFHESIALCMDPRVPEEITRTMYADDTLDLTHKLLKKLGLEEKAPKANK